MAPRFVKGDCVPLWLRSITPARTAPSRSRRWAVLRGTGGTVDELRRSARKEAEAGAQDAAGGEAGAGWAHPAYTERKVDFNTEGMIHIGLLPEVIEDARRDGVTDKTLEPLFRSAEAYIRMWEKAEARAKELAK